MGNAKKQFDDATEWHPFIPNPTNYCSVCFHATRGVGIHRYDDIRERIELRPDGMGRALEMLKEKTNETHR